MRWEEVAAAYRGVFERVAPAAAQVEPSIDTAALLAAAGA
jgi:hypothetical protein